MNGNSNNLLSFHCTWPSNTSHWTRQTHLIITETNTKASKHTHTHTQDYFWPRSTVKPKTGCVDSETDIIKLKSAQSKFQISHFNSPKTLLVLRSLWCHRHLTTHPARYWPCPLRPPCLFILPNVKDPTKQEALNMRGFIFVLFFW